MQLYHSCSTKTSNLKTKKFGSISRHKNKINEKRKLSFNNKEVKLKNENPFIKIYYKSSNNFFKEEGNDNNFSSKRIQYFNTNENLNNFNKISYRSYRKVESDYENSQNSLSKANSPYIFNEYRHMSNKLKKSNINHNFNNKNNEFQEDSGYFENNCNKFNIKEYYENQYDSETQNKYDNKIIIQKSPSFRYNQFQGKINFFPSPMEEQSEKSKNIINKVFQNNFYEKKIKVRTINKNIQNFGNTTTTTNNTYNNNIYCINSYDLSQKKHKSHIIKKYNAKNENNSYIINTQRRIKNNERDYFKIHNIKNSEKDIYISAAILIQSKFRGYLVKLNLFKYIDSCLCCQKGLEIIELLLLKRKKLFFNIFHLNIKSKILFYNSQKSSSFPFRLKSKINKDNIKELISELNNIEQNSSNKINDLKDYEINILKFKLNEITKENNQLKIKLFDLKYNEEKLQILIDENKKFHSINEIILKNNQQLSEKLKEIQKFKNNNLIIENQSQFYISKEEIIHNQDSIKRKEIYVNKLKKFMTEKFVYKKMGNNNSNLCEEKINKFKKKNFDNHLEKELYLKNLLNIIGRHLNLKINKYFWKLYKFLQIEKEKKIHELLLKNKLKKIIYKKEQDIKIILRKIFFKFVINSIKFNKDDKKLIKLKKIFKKYEKDVSLIYKITLEKWNLKSKIIGIKNAEKDRKKKRKQKKKINKLIYNKYHNLSENNESENNFDLKFGENTSLFRAATSNGIKDKEFFLNKFANLLANSSVNNRYNTLNILNNEDIKNEKKTKSLNKKYNSNEYLFKFKSNNINSIKSRIDNNINNIK